jgi:hypothetical protein
VYAIGQSRHLFALDLSWSVDHNRPCSEDFGWSGGSVPHFTGEKMVWVTFNDEAGLECRVNVGQIACVAAIGPHKIKLRLVNAFEIVVDDESEIKKISTAINTDNDLTCQQLF